MNIKASRGPTKGEDGRYHILYKTVNKINGKIYVGLHSTKLLNSQAYVGCGIRFNINPNLDRSKNALRRSPLWRAVLKHGKKNFERINLLYFQTREKLITTERQLIDRDFVNKRWNYNGAIGGGVPPINEGEKNGNYGNRWSDKKKAELGEYFKENRDTKGGKNNRAKRCLTIDLENSFKIQHYDHGKAMADAIGITYFSVYTWFRDPILLSDAVRQKRYICFLEEDFKALSESQLREWLRRVIFNSHLKLEVKKQYIYDISKRH